MKSKLSLLGVALLLQSTIVVSDPSGESLKDSALQICERVKNCAFENISIGSMDNGTQAMLDSFVDSLCVQIATPLVASLDASEYSDGAQQCANDVLALDCSELLSGKTNSLESCEAVKQAARDNGINVN